jgi:hypothetical protein
LYEDTFFAVGTFIGICAIFVFLPLLPSIAGLSLNYSRAAHFLIVSDVRFVLMLVLGIVGMLLMVYPSVGRD